MDHQWHYICDSKSKGPVSTSELQKLIARGELRSDDLVWREGMTDWSSVASMNFTRRVAAPPPVPSAPSTTAPPVASQYKQRTRPRRTPVNQRVVVWSIVAIVTILLCVGWVFMSQRRSTTKRQRSAVPSTPTARPSETRKQKEKRSGVAPVVRPVDEAVQEVPGPLFVDTIREVAPPPQLPAEAAKPMVDSRQPDMTVNKPPQPAPATAPPRPQAPAKRTLFQVVDIRRRPTFSIQGLETKQSLHYRVLSRLNIEHGAESRTTKVVQFVDDTRLIAADDASRESFSRALDNLKRQQYTYRLNHRGEVIEFTGHKENRTTIPLDLASSTGFQLTSVIDEDGWKELAELTFVVPPDGQRANEPWKRQMTHDFGALGSWSGITTFTPQPPKEQLAQISFTREIKYTAPRPGTGGLPFQIRDAAFEVQQASGTITFDVSERRVLKATEDFAVRGTVSAELAGVGVKIGIIEQQRIDIILSEQRLSLQ